jgi:CRP-like cAMP-binding protein
MNNPARATKDQNQGVPGDLEGAVQSSELRKLAGRIQTLKDKEGTGCRAVRLEKYSHAFTYGERADALYLVEGGQVKLVAPTTDGEEGLLDIYSTGDVFGESCLFGQSSRSESAIAMMDSTLLKVPQRVLRNALQRGATFDELLHHFLERSADQRQLLAALLAVKKEDRLALTLLYLARRIGRQDSEGVCIEHRILLEELAGMTGTRRTRIGVFLQKFRQLGMIRTNESGQLVVIGSRIRHFLGHNSPGEHAIDRLDPKTFLEKDSSKQPASNLMASIA